MSIKPSKSSSSINDPSASPSRSYQEGSVPNGKSPSSLKRKSRLSVNAVKLGNDDNEKINTDDIRRAKKVKFETVPNSIIPQAKRSENGSYFENDTCQKNPRDTPVRFRSDVKGEKFKNYEHRTARDEAVVASESGHDPRGDSGSPGFVNVEQPDFSESTEPVQGDALGHSGPEDDGRQVDGIESPESKNKQKNLVRRRKRTKRKKHDWGNASDVDVKWAKSLSDFHLDLMGSIKQLAMERVRSTKQKSLYGSLTPAGLRTIGIILEEFVLDRVRTLRSVPDVPSSVLDDLLACMDKVDNNCEESNLSETATNPSERAEVLSTPNIDPVRQSFHEGDIGWATHNDLNGSSDLGNVGGLAMLGGASEDGGSLNSSQSPEKCEAMQREAKRAETKKGRKK